MIRMNLPQFDLVFKECRVDSVNRPNIWVFFEIRCTNSQEFKSNEYVKLGPIKYEGVLNFLNENLGIISTDDIVTQYSHTYQMPALDGKLIQSSIVLKFSNEILNDVLTHHICGHKIEMKIKATIEYELLEKTNINFILKFPIGTHPSYIHDNVRSGGVLLNSDIISDIIRSNGASVTIPISIPIPILEESNSSLSRALSHLQTVTASYTGGKIGEFLINIRNVVLNDLTELSPDPNNPGRDLRLLNKEIIDQCISRIPVEGRKDYEKIIANVGKMTTDLLRNIHIFVHENTTEILRWPYAGDLEIMYFSVCLIIRYLHRITSDELYISKQQNT